MRKERLAAGYVFMATAVLITGMLCIGAMFGWWHNLDYAVMGVANAEGNFEKEVLPPNNVNFLTGSWHPAPECVQCHVSLLSTEELRAKLGTCNCHNKKYSTSGGIDMQKIRESAHGIKVCIDCHIGTGLMDHTNISSDKFHRAHQDVRCESCHLKEGSSEPFVPEVSECDACHGRDPHMVHGNKTTDLCVVCHGAFGEKYKREGIIPPEIGGRNESEQKAPPFPTISQMFKNIMSGLSGFIRLPI
ncbi:MAG: hypothetical protein OCU22_05240 [Canidatus Methanoxibalbensis ujae]|nr:hypothetical protein [Candidatus Methanoxibalbensis ujae]